MSSQDSASFKKSRLIGSLISLHLSSERTVESNFTFVLDSIITHGLFNEKEEPNEELSLAYKKWVQRLNLLLQSKNPTVRYCVISLIKTTCKQSHTLLLANAKQWSAQLLGFLAKKDLPLIYQESIDTLSFIFSYTVNKPELQREITSPNLPRFNQLLIQLSQDAELLYPAITALTLNMKNFPTTSKHVVSDCKKLCLSYMNGKKILDDQTQKAINQCYISLNYTSGKSTMAIDWKNNLMQLISTVNKDLDTLFNTVDEENQNTQLPAPLEMEVVSSDYVQAYPHLLRRIQLIQQCISDYLTTPTSLVVDVPVSYLIDLVCRIYNVYDGSLMRDYKDKNEFMTMMMCLPKLHLSTSKLLSSLFYCSGQQLVGFVKLFSQIFLRLLNEYKTRRGLKIAVYGLISLCLEKCGYVFAEIIYRPLISSVIEDLRIIEHKSAGIIITSGQSNKSHKKRKTEVTNSDALTTKLVSASPTDVQISALQTLQSLYDVFGFAMDISQRSSIDSCIISRLIQMNPPSDLNSEELSMVKAELYHCLISSITHPIETQASVLPHAMRLFGAGLNEPSHQLQMICRKGLSICDLIAHPRLPPVQRAIPKMSSTVIFAQESMDIDSTHETVLDNGINSTQSNVTDTRLSQEKETHSIVESGDKVVRVEDKTQTIIESTIHTVQVEDITQGGVGKIAEDRIQDSVNETAEDKTQTDVDKSAEVETMDQSAEVESVNHTADKTQPTMTTSTEAPILKETLRKEPTVEKIDLEKMHVNDIITAYAGADVPIPVTLLSNEYVKSPPTSFSVANNTDKVDKTMITSDIETVTIETEIHHHSVTDMDASSNSQSMDLSSLEKMKDTVDKVRENIVDKEQTSDHDDLNMDDLIDMAGPDSDDEEL
ncbi:rRNA processing/ribosome biogenesis-domain-containing protein [Pilobolus umbonatus]|nr:rRNA processing/ribosome biogenesis-domain-containing protein [Pilobolus umbonatus]